MSSEIHALTGQASVTVTKVTDTAMHIKVVGTDVYVFPSSGVEVKVTAGSISHSGSETIAWPGAVVEFSNEVVKQVGMTGMVEWEDLYSITTAAIELGDTETASFTFDSSTGHMYANKPCTALIYCEGMDVEYAKYEYSPPSISVGTGSTSGLQIDPAISQTFSAIVFAIYRPPGWPYIKAQVISEKIQMPSDTRTQEVYRINLPTVLTPEGEWVKPVNWDSDSYDKANAYPNATDGVKEGPDKDGPYALNSYTLKKAKAAGSEIHLDTYGVSSAIKGYNPESGTYVPEIQTTQLPDTHVLSPNYKESDKFEKDRAKLAAAIADDTLSYAAVTGKENVQYKIVTQG